MATHPNWKELDQQVTVSPQIRPDDVREIAAAGYRVVMCNRPDGEAANQANWAEVAEACRQNGVTPKYVPQSDRTPTPLVITIHGFAQWPANQRDVSRWNPLADEYGFIVVYPSGTGFPKR